MTRLHPILARWGRYHKLIFDRGPHGGVYYGRGYDCPQEAATSDECRWDMDRLNLGRGPYGEPRKLLRTNIRGGLVYRISDDGHWTEHPDYPGYWWGVRHEVN